MTGSTSSPPTARSTGGRSRRSRPRASRRSRRRSSHCPTGSGRSQFDDIDALAAALDDRVAAVMLEPVQGEGGVNPASHEYLAAVRELCDEREALLIMDEVQTGLGRTGRWFGFEHSGIRPDIVTMAKALGNGVPIGACWARAEVADAFRPGDHATTFGGQPLAARAALDGARRHGTRAGSRTRPSAPARGSRRRCRRSPASSRCAASACCSRPSSRDGIDAKDVAQRCDGGGLDRQRGDRRAPCASRRRCSSPTRRSTKRSRSSLRSSPRCRHDPRPPRDRRSRSRAAGRTSSTAPIAWKAAPDTVRRVLAGHERRRALPEAVGPHAGLGRGRGGDARRPPDLPPRRRGRHRPPRDAPKTSRARSRACAA